MDDSSRRSRKRERTRRQILDAAAGLVGAQGLDAVRIEAICDAADVARATFFLHFASKRAMLAEWENELAADVEVGLDAAGADAAAQLRAIAERLFRRPGVSRALLIEALAGGSAGRLEALLRRVALPSAQPAGRPPSKRLARLVLGALLGALSGLEMYTPERAGAHCDEVVRVLLYGVAGAKPRLKWSPGQP